MKTLDLLPRLDTNEIFVEVVSARDGNRGLLRRRLVLDRCGLPVSVESDLLATFHARIVGIKVDGDATDDRSARVYTVAVKSKYGPKVFDVPARAFDGSSAGVQLFFKRLHRKGLSGIAYPGRAAATVRACVALSRQGEPMP